jgi:murein L,D-transpeptidase YcbB/YkuD
MPAPADAPVLRRPGAAVMFGHDCRDALTMKSIATLLAGAILLVATHPADADADPVVEAISQRVDFQSQTGKLTIAGGEIVSTTSLPQIYGEVGYQPLWRDPAKVRELIALVQESYDDGLSPVDYHLTPLARLWPTVLAQPTVDNIADLDVLATDAYSLLLYHLYFGKVDPKSLEPTWNFSSRELEGRQAADFVREAITSGQLRESVDALRPSHWMYLHGRQILHRYRSIAANGGWEPVPAGETLKPGTTDGRIVALRRRLAVTGDLAGHSLDDESYDEPLAVAVRSFQARHQLTADGAVGPATLAALNVPVEDRITQIRVNLERGRHVLHEIGDDDLVIVDIAGYELRYVHNRKVTWTSRVQVGQPFRQTPIFKSAIDHVIINPTWTVPPTILEKDVLPALRKDPGYLASRRLEVFDRQGRRIDPATIDWRRYTGKSFPYFLRQAAGPGNALGRVKIMFPNPYLVYLHDTPSRSLFEKDTRAFSSGCIRVEEPFELVQRLLADPAWDAAALQQEVETGQTRTIRLAKPVPLLLIYWTMDEADDGRVMFRQDVYERDPPLARALNDRFAYGSRAGL